MQFQVHKLSLSGPMYMSILTLWRSEISLRVLWQTVKTHMKCHINAAFHQSLHCLLRKFDLQRKIYNIVGNDNL